MGEELLEIILHYEQIMFSLLFLLIIICFIQAVMMEILGKIILFSLNIGILFLMYWKFTQFKELITLFYEFDTNNIFLRNYTWHVKEALRLDEMAKCMDILTGNHDFSAFKSSGSGNINPVRMSGAGR